MKTGGVVYTIVFSFLAAFVFVAILGLANEFTKARIEKNREIATQKAVLRACAVAFGSDEEANTLFNDRIRKMDRDGNALYVLEDADRGVIYALPFSGQGLWGTITGILAVNADVSVITGVEIIAHNETPGLGGKIDEPYFKEQFRQEKITGRIDIGPGGSGDADHTNSRVDGITGASQTSQLFAVIINNSLERIKVLVRGLA